MNRFGGRSLPYLSFLGGFTFGCGGMYTRDLATTTGRIEDLKVPRDREGQFHTQAFERYQRVRAAHRAIRLTQMFVAGTRTRYQSGKWLKP